jgi:NTP pyrophosphatase (non-canonical NTP hydrolase)
VGWRWIPDGDGLFWLEGPLSADQTAEWLRRFPGDAAVVCRTGDRTRTTTVEEALEASGIPSGTLLGLPANPTESGPARYVVRRLLADDGCPWDREQTPRSLLRYLWEEPEEAAAAILGEEWDLLRDELGDVLFQVLLQSAIQEREGRWTLDAVVDALVDKLVRRHPHVFGDAATGGSMPDWQHLKNQEGQKPNGDERAMAALMRIRRALDHGWTLPGPGRAARVAWRERLATWFDGEPDTVRTNVLAVLAAVVDVASARGLDPETVVRETFTAP